MQSQRKNSGSYFTRQQSTTFQGPKPTSINKKKYSVASQTDNFPNLGKGEALCNVASMSLEEIRENYINTLHFLNNCHDFFNKIFGGSMTTFGDTKFEKMFNFRVPEIPNYFNVLELFLEKTRAASDDLMFNKHLNFVKLKDNVGEQSARDREMAEEQIIFDLQQFLPKNIGDGPSSGKNSPPMMPMFSVDNSSRNFNHGEDGGAENYFVKDISGSVKNFRTKNRPSTSPSRLVKSEKDILKKPSRHELKALSTTFEEILKTCNEFERKSKEHLLQDTPLECDQHVGRNEADKKDTLSLEEVKHADHKSQLDGPKHTIRENLEEMFDMSESSSAPTKNATNSFNLIEYALKNLRESEYDSDSLPPTPRKKSNKNIEQKKIIPGQVLLTENLPDIIYNFQKVSSTKKKSYTLLNEACQTKSTKIVNEMFKNISKENISDKTKSIYNLNDIQNLNRLEENDNSHNGCEKQKYGLNDDENCEENCDIKLVSSSDSIILTDKEFERKNRNNLLAWTPRKIVKEQHKKKKLNLCDTTDKPVKSHPLKLTDKDRSAADQRILQAIGIFTDKGDIRPGIINILEEKQRVGLIPNPAKNVKFRTERKFDFKVHCNSSDFSKKIPRQPSEESLSIKSCADHQNIMSGNTSTRSSVVTYSSSTVSDSDLLSLEPNSDQTLINKF